MAKVKPKTKPHRRQCAFWETQLHYPDQSDNNFTAQTDVVSVQDTVNGLEWKGKVSSWKANEIRVRLRAKGARGKDGKVGVPPIDGGDLTVTITSPVKPVEPVPVDYVNDNEA